LNLVSFEHVVAMLVERPTLQTRRAFRGSGEPRHM
jgi:hypothetical protein